MPNRISTTWEYLRTSFWMLPTLMALAAVLLAIGLVVIDHTYPAILSSNITWLPPPQLDAARTLLSALVGAMITVVSVVFSITIVALTLAASQLGPRLLRTFTIDLGNQIVLGTFVGTFLYCLLTLWMVGMFDVDIVPELSTLGALLLAVTSVGVLIFFIHHMSQMIQSQRVILAVGHELHQAIDNLYPPFDPAEAMTAQESKCIDVREQCIIHNSRNAYLQFINVEKLMMLACKHDLCISTRKRPGRFTICHEYLAVVHSSRGIDEELQHELHDCFVLGLRRTPTQDVEFTVDQLVEVALRALSPSLNDPFTAMQAVDQLGAAVARLGKRRIPPHEQFDEHGTLRLIVDAADFPGIVNAMFDQIRQAARNNLAVLIHIMQVMQRVFEQLETDAQRTALWAQANEVKHYAEQCADTGRDREDVERSFRAIASVMHDGDARRE